MDINNLLDPRFVYSPWFFLFPLVLSLFLHFIYHLYLHDSNIYGFLFLLEIVEYLFRDLKDYQTGSLVLIQPNI